MQTPTLRQFFRRQLRHGFEHCGLSHPPTEEYVSDVLTRFAESKAAYPVADSEGRSIQDLSGLLMAMAEPRENGPRPHTVRILLMRRHMGEFALFMSGLFRERLSRRGTLAWYLDQGRGAYASCAASEPDAERARVFHRLGRQFDRFADALDYLRHDQWPMPPTTLIPAETGFSPLSALWRLN